MNLKKPKHKPIETRWDVLSISMFFNIKMIKNYQQVLYLNKFDINQSIDELMLKKQKFLFFGMLLALQFP
jgi:hypothetical protein